ncbi:MAG: Re/Si-specific NAD(P)(+) transhydrogenase subunit alpha [Holosporaceae bacterium]|jgi:NAD(P) transhydrogenase subunit alpha|nr:Re/Si-specific NAD(P)(+) transhydrogenase subunit alpha [Holosporaceae bacterium]
MKISAIIDEKEKRVAITPETVKKYMGIGLEVALPQNYGVTSLFSDADYVAAGAKIEKTKNISDADLYLAVRPSLTGKNKLKRDSYLIALLSPFQNKEVLEKLRADGVHLCALEKIPRITRAQSMDVLSSQANISGYRAMLEALYHYGRVVPMMMTAAGTIRPAKVLVIGAGIAGLQAIATAKRLGAIVYAFDVRAAAKEQAESLGAAFITVESDENGEIAGGYAKEMSKDYKKRQMEKLAQMIAKMDIVVTTAQIPGKQAPLLVTKEMVESMPFGSVILDMAVETGGNCELSKKDKTLTLGNVTIIGYTDFAARVANDSSQLFARNVFNLVSLMIKNGKIDLTDEIIQAVLI